MQNEDASHGSSWTTAGNFDASLTIDSSWSLTRNPNQLSWEGYSTSSTHGKVVVTFDSLSNSITKISIAAGGYDAPSLMWSWNVTLTNFSYDSNSIFSSDSSLVGHGVWASYSFDRNAAGSNFTQDLRSVTSVNLSGIFRQTHLANAGSLVSEPNAKSDLIICKTEGVVVSNFEAANRSRIIEVFSPLGGKVASANIEAGITEQRLSNLAPGLYFVRLEKSIKKVYIPF